MFVFVFVSWNISTSPFCSALEDKDLYLYLHLYLCLYLYLSVGISPQAYSALLWRIRLPCSKITTCAHRFQSERRTRNGNFSDKLWYAQICVKVNGGYYNFYKIIATIMESDYLAIETFQLCVYWLAAKKVHWYRPTLNEYTCKIQIQTHPQMKTQHTHLGKKKTSKQLGYWSTLNKYITIFKKHF